MEKSKTKDARSLSRDAQEAIRLKVVAAVFGGMKINDAARIFGVHRGTVSMWLKKHRELGPKALRKQRQGRPAGKKMISPKPARQVARLITDKTPDQLKLPFMLWTREAVRELVQKRTGVVASLMTVGRWLKEWGFTPQKPVRRAFEQDPEAVRRWLDEEYPAIRRAAKREGAEIHWGDEMGMRSDHQSGTSYGLRGRTPVIPGTGQRFRCNMISSLTNRGRLSFMVFKERFRVGVFLKFLRRLVKQSGRLLYLIIDGHPVHKAAKVKKWAIEHQHEIRLFYLPAYSPELNPDEFLNHDVKANAVGRRRAENQGELMADVRGYLRSTQKQPGVVTKFFHAPSVKYAMI